MCTSKGVILINTFKYNNIYINNSYSLLASLEHNPVIQKTVDKCIDDYYFKTKTVEEAEVEYQNFVINNLIIKSNLKQKPDLVIAGDLQNQLLASNFCASKNRIPFLGVYSACASFAESIIIGSTFIEAGFIKNFFSVTSAHNLASEKQFRFPIEYGALRHKVNTFTATGAVAALISKEKSNIKIESATIGRVMDMNYTDTNNMGAAMAPGAAEVIYDHLTNLKRKSSYYDLILTGDLGLYGIEITKEYLKKKYNLKVNNIKDAGAVLFDAKIDGEIAGGSGPICLPLTLFNKILLAKKYKKILIVATGSLHSSTSCKLTKSIPSVAHAISLEVI